MNISNSINCFGPDDSTKWGFTWGSGFWGYSKDVLISVQKLLENSISQADVFLKNPVKVLSMGSVSQSMEMTSESVGHGGWDYVYVKPTSEAEDRNISAWTQGAAGSGSWTSGSVSLTSWS